MLGLTTLPRDHPLHRLYRTSAGVVGGLLIAFGAFCLLRSHDRWLGIGVGDGFGAVLVVSGLLVVAAAVVGGNVAAQVNGHVGAAMILVGLLGLLLQRTDANVLELTVSDAVLLFVVGTLLLAAGFYGQVAASAPYGDGPEHAEERINARG